MQQLTQGTGETMIDLSRDGKLATYSKTDSTRGVWVVDVASGASTLLSATALAGNGGFSPDGQYVATLTYGNGPDGLIHPVAVVLSAADGKSLRQAKTPTRGDQMNWGPDNHSITYIDRADSAWNVHRMDDSGAGAPQNVTHFTTGRVTNYRWSPDGQKLALTRSIDGVMNVWVTDASGGNATQISQFPSGDILGLTWLPDSRHIAFIAGARSQDVVLIRNFR